MANRSHPITKVPVDLKTVAALGLVQGTRYVVYNAGVSSIRLAKVLSEPDPDTESISVPIHSDTFGFLTIGSEPQWAWVNGGFPSSLRVDEAS